MSEYWSFYCITCRHECEDSVNHGEDRLRKIWHHREAVRQLVNADADLEVTTYMGAAHISFVAWHADHHVQLRSEYYIEGDAEREKKYPPIELPQEKPLWELVEEMPGACFAIPPGNTEAPLKRFPWYRTLAKLVVQAGDRFQLRRQREPRGSLVVVTSPESPASE